MNLEKVNLGDFEGRVSYLNSNMKNYKSTTDHSVRSKVECQINKELELGNYQVVSNKPQVSSSLGAVPKPYDSIRLIHDLSRPNGGVNAFVEDSSCVYNTVDQATDLIGENSVLNKKDLRATYRIVPIRPSNFQYMGLSWLSLVIQMNAPSW